LVLHWAYPFAIYFHDTAGYFQSAKMKMFTGYRPYGYSVFINFCIYFKQSIYSVVFFQSLFYLIANIIFIFSIAYIYPFSKKLNFLLFVVLVSFANQQLYLTNMLISDSLFISLTLVWISCTLHILNSEKNNYFLLIIYTITCFCAAKVRYAGLIYPFIGLFVTAFFFRKKYGRLLLSATASLLVFFIIYRQGVKENKDFCGVETFSAFSGWARLNNALITLPQEGKEPKNKKFAEIHSFFKSFPDSVYSAPRVLTGQLMWNKEFPEKQYMAYKMKTNPNYPYIYRYVTMGKIYNDYAGYLIKNNLLYFFNHFYLSNLANVLYPRYDDIPEYLYRPVDESTQAVCNTDFTQFIPRVDIYKKYSSGWIQLKYFIYMLVFITLLVYFFAVKKIKLERNLKVIIYFMIFFLIGNSLFLGYAHPIVIRYIVSNEFLFSTVIMLLIDQYPKLKQTEIKKQVNNS
jgi:hypothetical protein